MVMPHQVANQAAVFVDLLRACPVRHPRRLYHGAVIAEIVDHAHESLVEHAQRLAEDGVERRNLGA